MLPNLQKCPAFARRLYREWRLLLPLFLSWKLKLQIKAQSDAARSSKVPLVTFQNAGPISPSVHRHMEAQMLHMCPCWRSHITGALAATSKSNFSSPSEKFPFPLKCFSDSFYFIFCIYFFLCCILFNLESDLASSPAIYFPPATIQFRHETQN